MTLFWGVVLLCAVFIIVGFLLGYSKGYDDGYKDGIDSANN